MEKYHKVLLDITGTSEAHEVSTLTGENGEVDVTGKDESHLLNSVCWNIRDKSAQHRNTPSAV